MERMLGALSAYLGVMLGVAAVLALAALVWEAVGKWTKRF